MRRAIAMLAATLAVVPGAAVAARASATLTVSARVVSSARLPDPATTVGRIRAGGGTESLVVNARGDVLPLRVSLPPAPHAARTVIILVDA